jgi:hypothetical protein
MPETHPHLAPLVNPPHLPKDSEVSSSEHSDQEQLLNQHSPDPLPPEETPKQTNLLINAKELREKTLYKLYGVESSDSLAEQYLTCDVNPRSQFIAKYGKASRVLITLLELCGMTTSSWGGRTYRVCFLAVTLAIFVIQVVSYADPYLATNLWPVMTIWTLWFLSIISTQVLSLCLTWRDRYRFEKLILRLSIHKTQVQKSENSVKFAVTISSVASIAYFLVILFALFGPSKTLQDVMRSNIVAVNYEGYAIFLGFFFLPLSFIWWIMPGIMVAFPCDLVKYHLELVESITKSYSEDPDAVIFAIVREAYCYVSKLHIRAINKWMEWYLFLSLSTFLPMSIFLAYVIIFESKHSEFMAVCISWLLVCLFFMLSVVSPAAATNARRHHLMQYATEQEYVQGSEIELMLLIKVMANNQDEIRIAGFFHVTWTLIFYGVSFFISAFVILYTFAK